MSASTTFINNLLNAAFRGTGYTSGTIKMKLFTGNTPSNGGTEVTGGSYAAQTLSFSAAASKSISTSANAVFTNLPTSSTIVAYGIYDGTTLLDDGTLTAPFTPSVTNNELDVAYSFNLSA